MNKNKVGIVGSGTIGRGWIILFAKAGFEVSVFDDAEGAVKTALEAVQRSMQDMQQLGVIDDADVAFERVSIATTLAEAVSDAVYVQESVHEDEAIKEAVFLDMDKHAHDDAILASSCSAILPERFLENVPGRERCIIAHPISPPHAVPLVEVVTTPWNKPEWVQKVCDLLEQIGQIPAVINKPVYGFVVNRLQAAVINEAMYLVKEGVVSPRDLDRCMKHGLGLRWAFLGPYETMDLNAPGGFKEYTTKFSDAYRALGASLSVNEEWDANTLKIIEEWRRSEYPVEAIEDKRAWRDRLLLELQQMINSRQVS